MFVFDTVARHRHVYAILSIFTFCCDITASQGASSRTRFLIARETDVNTAASGCVMICPAHAYGTADDAERILRQTLPQKPREMLATIIICQFNQMETLKRFAPLVPRIVINPFVMTDRHPPRADDVCWPSYSHPVLDELREIRRSAGRTQLLGIIDLNGDRGLFGKRKPAAEEIEWQALALVGAGFQGIIWRGDPAATPFSAQLLRLQTLFQRYSLELGECNAVDWVSAKDCSCPVSALTNGSQLFILVLNSDYIRVAPVEKATVQFPLQDSSQAVSLELRLPNGLNVKSMRTASGNDLNPIREGGKFWLKCDLHTGGEFIVCQLSK